MTETGGYYGLVPVDAAGLSPSVKIPSESRALSNRVLTLAITTNKLQRLRLPLLRVALTAS